MDIFVGTDRSQYLAYLVLEASIIETANSEVRVHSLANIEPMQPKTKENRSRTPFSFSRFEIPKLMDYNGRALYMDADMQVFSDIGELFRLNMKGYSILVQSEEDHNYKFKDGSDRPIQNSVSLLDCEKLRWNRADIIAGLDTDYDYAGLMYNLCIVDPSQIGYEIPTFWNSLEVYNKTTKNIHYTDMYEQPWVSVLNENVQVWTQYLAKLVARGDISEELILLEIEEGYARPSLILEVNDIINDSRKSDESYHHIDQAQAFSPHKKFKQLLKNAS